MMSAYRTLDEADVRGKRVLLRVDLNVPMTNGKVGDVTRLERVAPTVTEIADKGGKVILLSHLDRPKGRDPKLSLRPVAAALSQVLSRPVDFAEECVGPGVQARIGAMTPGEVLCLENTRFHPGEEHNDPAFVTALASLGDLWVNDAFSAAHRAHASTEGLGHVLPAYAGRAMQRELDALGKVFETPEHPLLALVGGAKVSTKLNLLQNLIAKVDTLAIGGAMANTFLAAQSNPIGTSLVEPDLLPIAKDIMAAAKNCAHELILPVDAVVAHSFAAHAPCRVVAVDAVGADEMILDLGPRSVEHLLAVLARAKTMIWNGPVGAFELEPFDHATIELARATANLTAAGKLTSVAGGGDTIAALKRAGVLERLSYVSTAGGAFLEWLEGKPLPGVDVLRVKDPRIAGR